MKTILGAALVGAVLGAVPLQAANHPAPAAKHPAQAAKPTCPCACPPPRKAAKAVHKPVRQAAVHPRHRRHRYAYDYDDAEAVGGWVGYGPMPGYYGPPPGYGGMTIDPRGFTGGVGYGAGGGFIDGYGQVHYWGGGPSYNSYGQSFQYNPSRPGPFVPQRMGAPAYGGRFR